MNEKELLTIAGASETSYREASFGGGRPSSIMNLFRLCWDPNNEAFVVGHQYGFGSGNPWRWESYPCPRALAEGILTLCTDEEIQDRFLRDLFSEKDDRELFLCGDSVVGLCRNAAYRRSGGMGYAFLTSLSFTFYGADGTTITVKLRTELMQSLARRLKEVGSEAVSKLFDNPAIAA